MKLHDSSQMKVLKGAQTQGIGISAGQGKTAGRGTKARVLVWRLGAPVPPGR